MYMKKKSVIVAMAFTALAAAGIAVADSNHSGLSDVQLANIEALSRGESPSHMSRCYTTFKYVAGHAVLKCENCMILYNQAPMYEYIFKYCDKL